MPSSAKLKLSELLTQPGVVGAESLAELQLRIYLHRGSCWVDEMQTWACLSELSTRTAESYHTLAGVVY